MARHFVWTTWVFGVSLALAFAAAPLTGQEPTPADTQRIEQRMDDITGHLQRMTDAINQLNSEMVKKSDLDAAVEASLQRTMADRELAADGGRSEATLPEVAVEVAKPAQNGATASEDPDLKEAFAELKRRLDQHTQRLDRHEQPLDAVVVETETGFQPREPLLKPDFNEPSIVREVKRRVDDAVETALTRTGELVVENELTAGYTMRINGDDFFIPARSVRRFETPVGRLTTELVGFETTRSWNITGPDYRQKVIIGPRPVEERTETAKPIGDSYEDIDDGRRSILRRLDVAERTTWKPLDTSSSYVSSGSYTPTVTAYSPIVSYSPVVTSYSPVVNTYSPVVTSYSPVVSVYSPVFTSYSPVVRTYSPVVQTYSPVVTYSPVYTPVVLRRGILFPNRWRVIYP